LPIPQKSANKQKLLLLLLLLSSSISLVCSLNMEIVTPDEVLQYGLCMSGMDLPRQMKRNRSSRLQKFNDLYGSKPVVYAAIWEDILLSDDPGIRVEGNDRTVTGGLHKLLMACMFLYCYPTGSLLSSFFKICERLGKGQPIWRWIHKLHALKEKKIVWKERWDNPNSETYIITVDGVHCRIREPGHDQWSKNPQYYSHKNKCAGFNYELGISIYENSLVWIAGSFMSSKHDLRTFREDGLADMIPAGKKAITDQGYRGDLVGVGKPVATRSSHDSEALRSFKGRASARHESFNGRIKNFDVLASTFRHKKELHVVAFTACCVIVQYQMEYGSPLFSV
jgi:hypothetical protein